jgi:ATP-binding cassette subfamily F protein uup
VKSAETALISVADLSLSYGNQVLLDGVTLALSPGEKAGLVGRNGCGKSSLLRILAGTEEANSGEISRKRQLRLGFLPQEFELDDDATVYECIRSGARDLAEALRRYEAGEGSERELAELQATIESTDAWNLDTRVKSLASSLGAPDLDAGIAHLSGGEKRRVALCRALVGKPDLLILDEPTNHLDSETIRWLEDFLRSFVGAVIFVTHDRYFLDVIATRIFEIHNGNCYTHPGNYTDFLESKALRDQIAGQAERRRQRFLRTELEWVRAGVKARTTKSRHRLEQFYAIEGQEAPPEEREMDLLLPPPPQMGNIVVELENAGARIEDGFGNKRWLFRNLSFSLRPGTCTGVVGRNGAGKTTLLRICMGERSPDEGKAKIGKRVETNYIDQTRMQLKGGGSVLDEVTDQDEVVFFGNQRLSARGYLRRFLFTDDRINERVDILSGGERARLMLAKVLKRGGNLLVLDEPTNDLDLPSLRILEEALSDFEGSVLVVSHDRYFLDRVCDQVIAFEEGGIRVEHGNYSYYLEKRLQREREDRQSWSPPKATTQKKTRSGRPRKLSYKETRELETMEETILAAESEVEEIQTKLNDPSFYVEHAAEAPALIAKLEAEKAKVAGLYERWEQLEAIRAEQESASKP